MPKRLEQESSFPLLKKVGREFSWGIHLLPWNLGCLWGFTCTESQNNFKVYMPLQAAEVNFCDQRDYTLSVKRVVAGAVEKNLSKLELLRISLLASKPIAVSHLCWKLQVSADWWKQIQIDWFSSRFSNEQWVVLGWWLREHIIMEWMNVNSTQQCRKCFGSFDWNCVFSHLIS